MLAFGDSAAKEMASIALPSTGACLQRVAVNTNLKAEKNVFDDERSFQSNFGIEKSTLILIRPDGYVAAEASPVVLRARGQRHGAARDVHWLTRDSAPYLVDRYSERRESAESLPATSTSKQETAV